LRRENRPFPFSPLLLRTAAAALILGLSACAPLPPLSPVAASGLAARLANDRCQKDFGKRPFREDDFEALLDQERWHWGTLDGGKVDGFEVQVSFDRSGGGKQVMVAIPEE
jgi:hypothetical protein